MTNEKRIVTVVYDGNSANQAASDLNKYHRSQAQKGLIA